MMHTTDLSLNAMLARGFDPADPAGSAEDQMFASFDARQDAVRGTSAIAAIRSSVVFVSPPALSCDRCFGDGSCVDKPFLAPVSDELDAPVLCTDCWLIDHGDDTFIPHAGRCQDKQTGTTPIDNPKEQQVTEPMIATIGDTPSDLDVPGNSRHDDLVESISAVYDLFDLTRFESLPEWKRLALAERAAPTVWNEARRDDPDNTSIPWRIANDAHVTQVWLTVDNDPSADRVWQYVTAAGNNVLMLVSDQSDGTSRYADFGCIGTLTARDDDDAADTIRRIRQMVGNVRRLGLAEFDDLDVDATEGDSGLAEFGDL